MGLSQATWPSSAPALWPAPTCHLCGDFFENIFFELSFLSFFLVKLSGYRPTKRLETTRENNPTSIRLKSIWNVRGDKVNFLQAINKFTLSLARMSATWLASRSICLQMMITAPLLLPWIPLTKWAHLSDGGQSLKRSQNAFTESVSITNCLKPRPHMILKPWYIAHKSASCTEQLSSLCAKENTKSLLSFLTIPPHPARLPTFSTKPSQDKITKLEGGGTPNRTCRNTLFRSGANSLHIHSRRDTFQKILDPT